MVVARVVVTRVVVARVVVARMVVARVVVARVVVARVVVARVVVGSAVGCRVRSCLQSAVRAALVVRVSRVDRCEHQLHLVEA